MRLCALILFLLFPVAGLAATPSVGAMSATDPIALSESTTVTVWCNATITDTDGYTDISAVNATLWDPASTTETASNDNTNHYANSTCSLSDGSGTTINAACAFSMQYYSNAAEWTCKLIATDDSSATGSNSVTSVTVNELKALSTGSTISFGELALGTTSSDYGITVTNTGNTEIDIGLDGYGSSDGDGYAMTCSIGSSEIPLANLRYNLTSEQDYNIGMTALTDSIAMLADFNLAKTTSGIPSTKSVFWKLRMPNSNIGGSCNGKIVVTAV